MSRPFRAPASARGIAVVAASLAAAACAPPAPPAPRPIEVRVLVLDFDPRLPQRGDRPLHQALGWNEPHALTDGYIADVRRATHGLVRYRIVDWRDVAAFPVKADGYRYTPATFLACWQNHDTCHQPDGVDYPRLLRDYAVTRRVEAGEIDELWIFGAPYFGFWESAMAGPRSFEINGGVYDSVAVSRPFAIMGFSYERGVAEMLHDLCHRTEATMTRIYGGWKADELTTPWARFAANQQQSGTAAVGSCHFPPNAEKPYDYANPRTVISSAPDWLRYPDLTGATAPIGRDAWGSVEPGPLAASRHDDPTYAGYHRGFMEWWLAHIPHAGGRGRDGRLDDWWEYVFHFDRYTPGGRPRQP